MTQEDILRVLKELKAIDYKTGLRAVGIKHLGNLEMNMGSVFAALKRLKNGKLVQTKGGRYWIE